MDLLDKEEAKERNFLPGDVTGLVAVKSCPIRNVGAGCEIDANVADGDLRGETEHTKAGDKAKGIEGDDGAAETVFWRVSVCESIQD